MVDHSGPRAELLKMRSSEDSMESRNNIHLGYVVLTRTPLNESRRCQKTHQLPISQSKGYLLYYAKK